MEFFHIWPEFRLGNDFRTDFVILNAHSGAWTAHFIELEGPSDSLYNSDGLIARKLNWALCQTQDRRSFVREYETYLRHEFAKLVAPFNGPAQNTLMGKGVGAAVELQHPKTLIDYNYHVIIGRSENFADDQRRAHQFHTVNHGVVTYDRVLATMKELESRYTTVKERQLALRRPGSRCHLD